VSDKKIPRQLGSSGTIGNYEADIISATDYYAFGSPMAGRTFSSPSYRYGFNNQEKDDEIAGAGNINTAMYWEYDTRLGRRWNLDPITKPWESPYACFANNPIVFSDPYGDDIKYHSFKDRVKVAWKRITSSSFRKDFNALRKKYNEKDENGKDKKDLEIITSGKSKETLSEAVHNGSTTEGKANGESSHKDMLRYNGNLDSRNVAYQQEGNSHYSIDVRKGYSQTKNLFLLSTISSDRFDKWEIAIIPTNYYQYGILESHSYTAGSGKNRGTLGFSIQNIGTPTWQSDMSTLGGDDFLITYVVRAMGIPIVYRVERSLFGGWDYKNKARISDSSPIMKTIKMGSIISITEAK